MEFVKFEKSRRKYKKYSAIMKNKRTGRFNRVDFGDKRYEQFRDSTGLGIYSHLNHNDPKRRSNYRSRHFKTAQRKYSPSWFSYNYLW
jgi:hypothetical protein